MKPLYMAQRTNGQPVLHLSDDASNTLCRLDIETEFYVVLVENNYKRNPHMCPVCMDETAHRLLSSQFNDL